MMTLAVMDDFIFIHFGSSSLPTGMGPKDLEFVSARIVYIRIN